jgi:hypothetical protein
MELIWVKLFLMLPKCLNYNFEIVCFTTEANKNIPLPIPSRKQNYKPIIHCSKKFQIIHISCTIICTKKIGFFGVFYQNNTICFETLKISWKKSILQATNDTKN